MRYLVDTNVWLDAILGRSGSEDVQRMLQTVPRGWLATTDYAVHSIGIYLCPSKPGMFRQFVVDLIELRVFTLHLSPSTFFSVLDVSATHQLSFDDAFQYVAAERDDLQIVSFDADFDRTPRGRKTPAQVVAELDAR